jgi:simple sugar transport system permease protein
VTGLLAANEVFSEQAFTALVAGAILAGAPLMFAALGELVSQRAGVLNIGLEGMMLIGAYAGFVAAYHGGCEWLGFGAGLLAGAGVAVLMVLFCVRWGLDQIVVGIAITLTCEGATALIFYSEFAESRPTLGAVHEVAVPGLSELPVVGGKGKSNGSIFTQPLIVYIGLALAVLVAWILRRTHMGLNVRAAGDAPAALDAAGVSVFATRAWAVLFAGAMAGLGGAYLSIVAAGLFQDTVVGGRGFIAIVLAMLARGRPLWAVVGAMLFGASLSIADWAQVAQVNISTDLVFMLPFILVLVVLVVFGRRAYLPAALALPYERGSR